MSCNLTHDKEEIERNFRQVNNENLWKELKSMVNSDMLYRKPMGSSHRIEKAPSKKIWDSLWNLQKKIDDQNTERLLETTKKYGFPNPTRTGKPYSVWMIFQHADSKYKDDILPILERELKANRIESTEYTMIKWNLSDRKTMPFKIK